MESPKKKEKVVADEPTVQLVISHVANQEFAAYIHQISEVLRYTHVTPIPDCPPFIAGIASFHSEMGVVIDLQRYFSLSKQSNQNAKHIIVVRHEKELYGLLVDEVSKIIRVPESSIKPAPDLTHQVNGDYISGIYTENEDQIITILNLERVLSKEMFSVMGNAKQKHLQEKSSSQEK